MVEAIRAYAPRSTSVFSSPNNRILVTGPSPGVGKSFVAANLAVTIAQGGQRVLLIDTDLRKGRLHNIFDIEKPGLTEVLGQKITRQRLPRALTT